MRTGSQYLESLRDGREVYLGGERITDVTSHPAFRNGARSLAMLYDLARDPEKAEQFTYSEDGHPCNLIFKRPRSVGDLAARRRVHEAWANATFGFIGRSPDSVAGFLTGMACEPAVFNLHGQGFDRHILDYWARARDRDLYVAYAVLPPAGSKMGAAPGAVTESPGLRVVKDDDAAVTVWGFKPLATGGVFADDVLIGNLLPLRPGEEPFAITCVIPIATPGVKLLSRKSFEQHAVHLIDDPLASRFDETDVVIFCDNVRVPWERVLSYRHIDTARAIFYDTPALPLTNAQGHVRLLAKMQLTLGVTRRVAEVFGTADIPAVKEALGTLAIGVAMLEALILAEEARPEVWPSGYVAPNQQTMHAAQAWTCEYFPEFIRQARLLLGSHIFQLPADASVFSNDYTAELFLRAGGGTYQEAVDRYRLMRLAWDLVGSEFANRHLQYEMLHSGPPHVTRGRMWQYFNWDAVLATVERCLEGYADAVDWEALRALAERRLGSSGVVASRKET